MASKPPPRVGASDHGIRSTSTPAVWPAGTVRDADGAIRSAARTPASSPPSSARRSTWSTRPTLRARADERAGPRSRAPPRAAGVHAHVYYAGKAFLSIEVARWMPDAGLRIDVCSGGELAVALAAGVEPRGSASTATTSASPRSTAAVEAGRRRDRLDSVQEVGRVADGRRRAHGPRAARCGCGSTAACTPRPTSTSRPPTRTRSSASPSTRRGRDRRPRSASQPALQLPRPALATSARRSSARRIRRGRRAACSPCTPSCSRAAPVPELNLGGGFGIAYTTRPRPVTPIDDARRRARARSSPPDARSSASPCPTSRSSRAAAIIGTGGRHPVHGRHDERRRGRDQDDGETAIRRYVERRRRDERQHPRRAVRRRLLGARSRTASRMPRRRWCAWPASTARAATSSCGRTTCPPTSAPGDLARRARDRRLLLVASPATTTSRPPAGRRRGRRRARACIVRGETIDDLLARDAGITDASGAAA